VATRLAYTLIGSTPPDWLLDSAEAGAIDLRVAAERLWNDARARERMGRFHALWLGYHDRSVPDAMRAETQALLERAIFTESRPWSSVFDFEESLLSPELAAHYGLPHPGGSEAWVSYGDSGRAGILSHGTFLGAAAGKDGDTSPTSRGLLIRTRLLCETVPPPPPTVNVDAPIPATEEAVCKIDRYAAHSQNGKCASCHRAIDPIGFGLERYDMEGRYREQEPTHPECPIAGEGEIVDVGTFRGPAELGALLNQTDSFGHCMATQLYRFVMGRSELDATDDQLVDSVALRIADGVPLSEIILDFVARDEFLHRREVP